jgi:GrpB-like predicted nucleotidyltransferase (UPF0157 family)
LRPDPSLTERLAAAGADPAADPQAAWRALRAAEGPRATVIDLYTLVAAPRGLAPHELPAEERLALGRWMLPQVWPGWTVTKDSERAGDTIEVAEPDPIWPRVFEQWRERLAGALRDTALRIDHVGSTSVPGLAAKPTIDVQVSVADLSDEGRYVPALEGLALRLRSRDDLHRYFRPAAGLPRSVHVHVCQTGTGWERVHLLFRDYLRGDPDACAAYAEAKREAAVVWADDRIAYTDAKAAVILRILDAAEAWARATSWSVS